MIFLEGLPIFTAKTVDFDQRVIYEATLFRKVPLKSTLVVNGLRHTAIV